MKMTAILGAGALATVTLWLTQSPAQATDALPTGLPQVSMPVFFQLDRNADGKLSFLEARQDKTLGLEFYRMDLDLDGYLSPQELDSVRV
ncbi:hypothetical protein [Marinobacterium rhizophilum]|uniref:EF-hand domain-containing protein n=1 Tax=Marinobacterium rhizophilum TaxID=420402 RepID=A0ABY5HJM5_9GAMM|nr:hypothetical protein [Marinobacterium rhizophilum]UTW12488.1 hypothetical protein KDW95_02040 [Marinobacterium rhizophilum]